MTTSDTMQLRKMLLDELRASPTPLSTTTLAERMPGKVEHSHDSCDLLCDRRAPSRGVEVLECHHSWHVVQYRRATHGYSGIYRHLRALETRGLIERSGAGTKQVCWTYTGPDRPTDPATTAPDRRHRAHPVTVSST